MNNQKREYIDSVVSAIQSNFSLTNKFDIDDLVGKLEGKIEISDSLEPDVDAKIEKKTNEENEFVITLPKKVSPNRRRFSIAHELGHLFLHMGYITDEEKWHSNVGLYEDKVFYRKGNQKQIEEYEANYFAGSLLMPRDEYIDKVIELTDEDGYCDMKELADYFSVSINAASVRGKILGCFSSII